MRLLAIGMCIGTALPALAQTRALTRADSALVGRLLAAEDRRDSTDTAFASGLGHDDPRVKTIAWRALSRIRDPKFAARDSLPALPLPMTWPEPAWRLRYRALATQRDDCRALHAAMSDSVWHVRLRAADLVGPACAGDTALVATLRSWVDSPRARVGRRRAGDVTWHGAAHAVVALARVSPASAQIGIRRLAARSEWHQRLYAARAAAVLSDTGMLRVLAADSSDNVKEAAIEALSKLTGHADDDVYLAALSSRGAQAVRAAAAALEGSPRADVSTAANATYLIWARRDNDSERDARAALLRAAGRPASDDRASSEPLTLPARAVALALGEDARLLVKMSPASGGGSFVVRLRGDVAPVMAARVLELARAKYYDGGNWHRVEPDFVIQGAGPGTNEFVGYRRYFRDELGTVPHARGTIGMSTRAHDTGDAQWFVNLKDNLRLNPDYTVFGEVVERMDVVDGILEGDVVASIREWTPPAKRAP